MQSTLFELPESDVDETGAWLSISDLMSGLLMIFALLLIAALAQLREAMEASENRRVVIIRALEQTLNAQGIHAEVDPQTGDISILDSVLFDRNDARLKVEGVEFLRKFVPVYSGAIFADAEVANQIQHVVIEGHTSSAGSWAHNMRLSLDRANSVSTLVTDLDFPGKSEFRSRLLVSGRGEADAEVQFDNSADRRVIFRFQFKSQDFKHWFEENLGAVDG